MAGSLTAGTARGGVGLLGAWRVHLWVFAITLVAEEIGNVKVSLGVTSVVLLPLVWSMIFGAVVSLCWRGLPRGVAVGPAEQVASASIIQVAVLLFVAKLALLVGGAVPELARAGWALAFQELGHFFGTAILAMPLALALGIKREAVGATFSVGREPSLAIIAERYGMSSPEGRGVLAEYITGTVLGAVVIALVASLLAGGRVFGPLALAMGAGVGSGSMMAAASGAIAAQFPAAMAKQIAAFAAASNLITTIIGTYFTLFLSLPFSNVLYRTLEPRLGRLSRPRSTQMYAPTAPVDGTPHTDQATSAATLLGLLAIVGVIALLLGNWITYHTAPDVAVGGTAIVVLVAWAGDLLKRAVPLRIPAVFWITALGMALTAPWWSGSAWMGHVTGHINFLALATPLLAYAGLSVAKDLPTFRALGWRIVVVSLVANVGTFLAAAVVAELFLPHA